MTKRQALLIPAILLVFGIVALIALKSQRSGAASEEADKAAEKNTPYPTEQSERRLTSQTKRERKSGADAQALRELEIEFDRILPAQFPEQPSSLCDATLEPGESLILGGFRNSDGNYEFTILEVEPLKMDGTPLKPGEMDGAPLQYRVWTKSLTMSHEASLKIGLGSLISPAKTRIQKNLIFTSAEVMQVLRGDTAGASAMPSVTARADTRAVISAGTEQQAHVISMMASPVEGSESVRLRSRVESPAAN